MVSFRVYRVDNGQRWYKSGYSAIDFTLLDPHYGTLQEWVDLVDRIHAKGMSIILDFTVGTMGDLIGFEGYVSFITFDLN